MGLGFSRNKDPIVKKIKSLEQGGLLTTNPSEEHEQKKIKTLTPLGHEFVKLNIDIDKHVKICYELLKLMLDILDIETYSDEKVQRSMLHNRGWTPEEIDEREMIFQSCKDSAYLVSPYEIVSVVLIRYISILSRIKNNDTAKTILNEIMMDKINNLLFDTIIKKDDKQLTWPEDGYEYLISEKFGPIESHFNEYYYPNRFTDLKVVDMLKSLTDVLQVSDTHIHRLTSLVEFITEYEYRKESRRRGL